MYEKVSDTMDWNGDHVEFEYSNGHKWTTNSIDEFVVGRIHGGYYINQIQFFITFSNLSLASITVAELESFWDQELKNPKNLHIPYGENMKLNDPRVQTVLNRMKPLFEQLQAIDK